MRYHWFLRASSIALLVFCLSGQAATARGLLRDADLEHGLKKLAAPILSAAGLNPDQVKVLVVDDSSLNAFVVGIDAVFLNYGLINQMDSPEMLQGVIAHEVAHIANGHITRRLNNLAAARTAAGFGVALAAIAGAAGGADAAGGVLLGTQGAARNRFFRHTRAEEAAADQSAVRFMRAAGVNPRGMSDVLKLFAGQELLSETRQEPYTRTHPLSRDRVRALEGYVVAYGDQVTGSAGADYWFARLRGKLTAHTRAPKWTLRRLPDTPYQDVRYLREAIAEHRQTQTKNALAAIDRAIAIRPDDAFYHDQRAEILLKSRNFAAAEAAYARAVQLAPRDALILSGYGRALLVNDKVQKAQQVLEKARSIDFRDGLMLRDLSVAYARSGQTGMAAMVTAERYALVGRMKDAGIHAKRAVDLLPEGSGAWQRAQDVLIASERAAKRR
ncbi:MAG: M48 family metalloprotease [Pseudomonadota bacterium]